MWTPMGLPDSPIPPDYRHITPPPTSAAATFFLSPAATTTTNNMATYALILSDAGPGGFAIARALALSAATTFAIIGVHTSDLDAAEAAVEHINKAGGNSAVLDLDAVDVMSAVKVRYAQLDILINAASDFEDTAKACLPLLRNSHRPGALVNIATPTATASKSSLQSAIVSTSRSEPRVRVNGICLVEGWWGSDSGVEVLARGVVELVGGRGGWETWLRNGGKGSAEGMDWRGYGTGAMWEVALEEREESQVRSNKCKVQDLGTLMGIEREKQRALAWELGTRVKLRRVEW